MKNLDGLTKALLFVAVFDTLFTITMIVLFCLYQTVPDILIESVFKATLGETSATAVIFVMKKIKEKGTDIIKDEDISDCDLVIDTESEDE